MSTPQIRLRAMEPEDLDFLYGLENSREVWDVGNTNVPYSRYVLHDYIANASNDIYRDGQVRMIVENSVGMVVGIVDVFDFNAQHRRAEVSIVVKKECRRKGYGSAVLAEVIDYSRRTLHLRQLYAIVAATNEASLAVFTKCGFGGENTLKDWLFDGSKYVDARLLQKIL